MTTLIFLGALGSLVFIIDYLATADLQLHFARLILSLNVGISGLLWVLYFRRLDILHGRPSLWVIVVLLALMDIAVWSQIYLLHKSRVKSERAKDHLYNGKHDDKKSPEEG